MKVYKVVRYYRYSRMLFASVIVNSHLVYARQRRVTPTPGWGPMCAFDSLKSAVAFAYEVGNPNGREIWEARARKSKANGVWAQDGVIPRILFPGGTVLCDAITLTRRVWPEEEK